MNKPIVLACLLAASALAGSISAQAEIGQFQSDADIGTVAHKGSVAFDAASSRYSVTGGGANIWAEKDAFHYVWTQRSGDLHIAADIAFGPRARQRSAPQGGVDDPPEPHAGIALCRCHGPRRRPGLAAVSRGTGRADPADHLNVDRRRAGYGSSARATMSISRSPARTACSTMPAAITGSHCRRPIMSASPSRRTTTR